MLVSTRGRYALRVLLELAEHGSDRYMCLDAVAQTQNISQKYLESIVSVLVKGGLVEGQRGRGGGYRLTRHPQDYTVGEILRLTEGSLAPVSCLECGTAHCQRSDHCRTLPMWQKLDEIICDYLDGVCLSDLMEGPSAASSN